MARAVNAADELRRLLCAMFAAFDCRLDIEQIVSRRWVSVTFSGHRHSVRLRLEGEGAAAAADALVEGLSEREFDLTGHVVADIALLSDERREDLGEVRLELEALTVEAA
ncbi:MAG TPA: hypothetical protein VGX37_11270 [Allosphingosinicella sp.]|jgi:hypothetical protein|nr:hypothetical protein [Allosphingosinicella sp.]